MFHSEEGRASVNKNLFVFFSSPFSHLNINIKVVFNHSTLESQRKAGAISGTRTVHAKTLVIIFFNYMFHLLIRVSTVNYSA